MSSTILAGKVCIVTGATRGIGKGIAVQLAVQGAKVYITGRTLDPPADTIGGSLRDTVSEIESRGGVCVAVQCDHSKDRDIEQLFEQVKKENDGQLDVLVNNAYSGVKAIYSATGVKFWNQALDMWDSINNVGLRNHYICSIHAANMMVPRQSGLIVNISSPGGLKYLFNCAYGIGKEACDRMAADCGHELRRENVAFVSLWPGPVGTETLTTLLQNDVNESSVSQSGDQISASSRKKMRDLESLEQGETPEFAGKCIAALATDPNIMKKSGKIQLTADLGQEYGLTDEVGHTPMNIRQVNTILRYSGYKKTARFVPDFVRIPRWMLALSGSKF